MFDQRIQVLLSAEQRRRLEAEARERGMSVGRLIREAIDLRYSPVTREMRIRAVEEIGRAKRGKFLTVREMDRIRDEDRLKEYGHLIKRRR